MVAFEAAAKTRTAWKDRLIACFCARTRWYMWYFNLCLVKISQSSGKAGRRVILSCALTMAFCRLINFAQQCMAVTFMALQFIVSLHCCVTPKTTKWKIISYELKAKEKNRKANTKNFSFQQMTLPFCSYPLTSCCRARKTNIFSSPFIFTSTFPPYSFITSIIHSKTMRTGIIVF